MNYRMIGYLLGVILVIEAALMSLPLFVSVFYGEQFTPFLITMAVMLLVSVPAVLQKPKNTQIYAKDGYVTVAAGWIFMSLFGALPFVLSGAIPGYIDAFFETVSGFTTTGASILNEIESLPRGILFWRSFTHWIGGMGVLVFVLALLPSGTGQTIYLMRAEVPGPTKSKLVPKMKFTSLILYGIYFALTVIMIVALLLCGMPLFDSVVSSLATAGTGGFSILNASIGGYNNAAAEWVIAIFMLLFGINFNVYFCLLLGRFRDALKSEELRAYLLICAASTALIAFNISRSFDNIFDCVRASFFQVTSIISTTGFSSADFNVWPEFSKAVLVFVMVTGACAGSTAGGLKISRVLILVKSIFREIRHMLRPRSINVVRLDGESLPDETVRSALGYLAIYVAIFITAFLAVSTDGFSFETNITATLATLNNVGPGLDAVGPSSNFSAFSPFSKVVFSLTMLFGRLEIMPMIIFFSPFAWKKR